MSAVIGNLPDVIAADSELRSYTVLTINAVFAVRTVPAICTVYAVPAGSTPLALFAGRLHTERGPACAIIIGDLPLVGSGIDAKLRRGCAGRRIRVL